METSCDETAAAIIKAKNNQVKILSNIVSSQIKIHQKYGGVFPELASRTHLENIIPVVNEAIDEAKIKLENIDLIAVTTGPGLIGSLLIGVNFAKTLAYTLQKPVIPVNHLEGHIFSSFAGETPNSKFLILNSAKLFPIISLVVSGGHTSLILMRRHGDFQTIGETQDDAAGEAFDKVAALLGLPYPGGPTIEAAASKFKSQISNLKITLPRPMLNSNNHDFSFSGLKTAVLYLIKQVPDGRKTNVSAFARQRAGYGGSAEVFNEGRRRAVAKEFQQAVIDVLISKTISAAKKYKTKTIILCGGVSANRALRKQMSEKIRQNIPNSLFFIPNSGLFTDNAAMIAIAGYYKSLKTKPQKWYDINADSNERLKNWVK